MEHAERERLKCDLIRLADGDRSAFDPVFARMQPVVRRFVHGQLGESDGDDVTQQALVNVFARISEFDRARDAYAWILGIAAFEVKTARKRIARRRELSEEAAPERSCEPATDEAFVNAELRRALHLSLGQLSPADAEALWAWAGVGERPLEGATFRKRVQRAMSRLRSAWRQAHVDD